MPVIVSEITYVFHQYMTRVASDRDGSVRILREEYQIGSGVYYPIPNHRLPSSACFASDLDLPAAEAAAREVISLLVHPSLDLEDLEWIVATVSALARAGT